MNNDRRPAPRILIVEDDCDLGQVLARYLDTRELNCTHLSDPSTVLGRLAEEPYDLCLLDVVMPAIDGFALAQKIHTLHPDLPFFFLTARGQRHDRLRGLSLGADDYITKPFDVEELELRIRNTLSRIQQPPVTKLQIGVYSLDRERCELVGPNGARHLTERELELLWLLARRNRTVVPRPEITRSIWGRHDYFISRSLDAFVSRLRKYLADDPKIRLRTIRSVGLMLDIDE